jgi:hypothetical protein
VLKPSPETVLDSYVFAEAVIAAGLPAGVVNIVPGGRELGAYLVQHRDVDKVAFTGSTAAGRQIAEVCGRLLRPVSLELGGKSAAIILDDADLDLAKVGQNLFSDRQRVRLRPRRLGLDRGQGPGAARHTARPHRHHGHQQLPARPGRPVGRRQVKRPRPRTRPRRHRRLPAPQNRLRVAAHRKIHGSE